MKESKSNNNKPNSNCFPIIVLVICTITLFFQCIDVPNGRIKSYGEWGNFIGGVFGTVIAGIACIYVYKTYISQKEELEKTNVTAKKQQFETTFFNLIRIYKESLQAIQYNSPYIKQTLDNETINDLWGAYENDTLEIEDYEKYFSEKQLQGEQAMRSEYDMLRRPKYELNYYEKYFYSVWLSSICQIIKYLKEYQSDFFYVELFYSQITRPEWWVLYDIYLNGKEFISDKDAFDHYTNLVETELVKEKKMFDYGFNYIVEKYKTIKRENVYNKTNI